MIAYFHDEYELVFLGVSRDLFYHIHYILDRDKVERGWYPFRVYITDNSYRIGNKRSALLMYVEIYECEHLDSNIMDRIQDLPTYDDNYRTPHATRINSAVVEQIERQKILRVADKMMAEYEGGAPVVPVEPAFSSSTGTEAPRGCERGH